MEICCLLRELKLGLCNRQHMYIRMCGLSHFSHVQLFATPWTIACQAPLSMGFSRQEYWSGLPFPSPGDLPNPGLNPHLSRLLHWQVGSLPLVPSGKPRTYVHLWLIHVDVWQKPNQYCKAIILQLKINELKKNTHTINQMQV